MPPTAPPVQRTKVHVRETVPMTERDDAADAIRDRAAIEAIVGQATAGEWPAGAMPPGTRVRVIKSQEWDGPWRQVFTATIDETISPRLVGPPGHPGELEYSVRFDEPQMDWSEDGPYRKAVIWSRYLEPL
jgi:hypothetical protein